MNLTKTVCALFLAS